MIQTRRKPAVLGLVEAARFVHLGRNAAYAAAEHGELAPGLPIIKVGSRKYVVPVAAIERLLGVDIFDHMPDESAAHD